MTLNKSKFNLILDDSFGYYWHNHHLLVFSSVLPGWMGAPKILHSNLQTPLHLFHTVIYSCQVCTLLGSIHGKEVKNVVISAERALAALESVVGDQL